MKLYLVRHGQALSEHVAAERPLSEKGKRDAAAMAAFLGRAGVRVSEVQHSGKARARETAELLAGAVADGRLVRRSGISPMDEVGSLVDEANASEDDMMVVGHLPFMGRAVSTLISGTDDLPVAAFQECACACLVRSSGGRWTLAWMVVPALLGD